MTTTLTVEQHIANVRGCELCSKITYVNIYDICESHWEERIVLAKYEDADVLSFLCKADPYFQEPQVKTELTPIERAHKLIADVRVCEGCIGQDYTKARLWCDTGELCETHQNVLDNLERDGVDLYDKYDAEGELLCPFYIAPETPKETTMSDELAAHIKSVQECTHRLCVTASNNANPDFVLCVFHQKQRGTIGKEYIAELNFYRGDDTNPYYLGNRMATPVPSPVSMDFTEGAKIIAREYAEKKRDEELLLQQFRQKREAEKVNEERADCARHGARFAQIWLSQQTIVQCDSDKHRGVCIYCTPYRNLVHVKHDYPHSTVAMPGRRFKTIREAYNHSQKLKMILEGGRVKE